MTTRIHEIEGPEDSAPYLGTLTQLLREAVDDGATVGFLAPLSEPEARAYWEALIARVGRDARIVVALDPRGDVVGTGQLLYAWQPNGRHRAEISKLLVDRRWQRRGLGLEVMRALERIAARDGRTLIMLNTRAGEGPVEFYRRAGYRVIGEVPAYTRNAAGELHATLLFYRLLEPMA